MIISDRIQEIFTHSDNEFNQLASGVAYWTVRFLIDQQLKQFWRWTWGNKVKWMILANKWQEACVSCFCFISTLSNSNYKSKFQKHLHNEFYNEFRFLWFTISLNNPFISTWCWNIKFWKIQFLIQFFYWNIHSLNVCYQIIWIGTREHWISKQKILERA